MGAEIPTDLAARVRVHAALGEPTRLAIVDALLLGDASPGEIGAALGLPTNLLAHHLSVFADAGLIERSRSEGDRRRTYLRLRHQALPALTPVQVQPAVRVAFVCTHNSARSQLAAVLWVNHSDIPAASAGTDPAPRVHPRAVRVARRHGMALRPTRTSYVRDVLHDDVVIAVCDNAHEHLPAQRRRLHWPVPDPAPVDIERHVRGLLAELKVTVVR